LSTVGDAMALDASSPAASTEKAKIVRNMVVKLSGTYSAARLFGRAKDAVTLHVCA
jgi:hypothetical protein